MALCIGFIGTGAIGLPIGHRLLDAGHALAVFDTRGEAATTLVARGARVAASAADAADSVDLVFTCLPSADALAIAYLGNQGILGARRPPPLAADLSTSGPDLARALGSELADAGIAFLDSPVSGGVSRARAGALTAMVSGSTEMLALAAPAIDAFASKTFVVGAEPGQAQIVKLINNVLSYTALAATSEALVVGRMAGIDLTGALAALNTGTGQNSATDSKIPDHVLPRTFDYGASNEISYKDLSLYLELAAGLQVPTPITSLLLNLLRMWLRDHADEDMTSIARLFEGWAGVELRAGPVCG